ncbi:DUF1310 family protein [Lactococcus muris]|uniref:DUF1310 family protein n=2 Tax=Lactococcus TaxID=1357 RepID=A0ABV4DD95_9LACT|nr:DUF1310 family protein [Lactococcus garvieae]
MKKNALMSMGILLAAILLIILGIGGKLYMDKKQFHNEMIRVVKSNQAKNVLDKGLKNLDSKALTPEGVIKSYEIDYKSIEHNPMGGINGKLYINNNKNLYVTFILGIDSEGKLDENQGISSYSSELEMILREAHNE